MKGKKKLLDKKTGKRVYSGFQKSKTANKKSKQKTYNAIHQKKK